MKLSYSIFFTSLMAASMVSGCGSSTPEPAGSDLQIKSGNYFATQDYQYRYQVAIMSCSVAPNGLSDLLNPSVCHRTCTGTIMKSNRILTAAHCHSSSSNTYVATYSASTLDGRAWKVSQVSYPFGTSPSNYRADNGNGYLHDLAMLRLSSDIPLGSTQLAAVLASQNPSGQKAYIGGAGRHDDRINVNYYLKWLEVNVSNVDLVNQILTLNNDFVDSGDSGSGIFTFTGTQANIHGVLSTHDLSWPFDYSYYTYTGFSHYSWVSQELN